MLASMIPGMFFMDVEEPSFHHQKYYLQLIALAKTQIYRVNYQPDLNISIKLLLEILRSIFKLMIKLVI